MTGRKNMNQAAFLFLLLLFAPLLPIKAFAGASPWLDNEGGRLRIVTAPPEEDGTVRGFIDIELKPGWKTYWRDPGETGIPPQIRFSGSAPLETADLLFPAPERINDGFSVWAGYTRPVRLPLVIRGAGSLPSPLEASLFIGVCEAICVPVSESISVPDADGNAALHAALVEQAFADLPEAPKPDFGVERLEDRGETVDVTVRLPSERIAAEAELFVAAPEGWRFGVPKRRSQHGTSVRFAVPVEERAENEAPVTLDIVVKGITRSVADTISLAAR